MLGEALCGHAGGPLRHGFFFCIPLAVPAPAPRHGPHCASRAPPACTGPEKISNYRLEKRCPRRGTAHHPSRHRGNTRKGHPVSKTRGPSFSRFASLPSVSPVADRRGDSFLRFRSIEITRYDQTARDRASPPGEPRRGIRNVPSIASAANHSVPTDYRLRNGMLRGAIKEHFFCGTRD